MPNSRQIHAGHRERMRDRFFTYGRDVFHTYELLEMLLYSVISCRDTNPVAKNLLAAFGSVDGVFSASRSELLAVDGVGERVADFLQSVGKINADALLYEPYASRIRLDTFAKAGEFACQKLLEEKERCILAVFLDNSMSVISSQILYRKIDFESAGVTVAPFLEAAVRVRAAAVILAHNHPYGPSIPSPGDRETQKLIETGFRSVGILPVEHYLVSGNSYCGITRIGTVYRLAQTAPADFGEGLMSPSEELVLAYEDFCRSREEASGGEVHD